MASFTAKSATSGGRVHTFGASLEPVRSVSCTFFFLFFAKILASLCIPNPDLYLFKIFVRCTTSSSAGGVRWDLIPTEWNPSFARCLLPLVNDDFCVWSDLVCEYLSLTLGYMV